MFEIGHTTQNLALSNISKHKGMFLQTGIILYQLTWCGTTPDTHTLIILELFLVGINYFWVQTKSNQILNTSNYPEHRYPECKFFKKHPKTTGLLGNQHHHQVLLHFPTSLHFQPFLLSYICTFSEERN